MSCEIGLAECLVLITMHDNPASCGSGLALGGGLVLTCAHVIDGTYFHTAYGEYTGPGSLVEANKTLVKRIGSPVAQVTQYDGIARTARLVAVDDHADMVLLMLEEAGPFGLRAPPIAQGITLQKSMSLLALGFARAAGSSYRLRCTALSPTANEDRSGSGNGASFDGDTSEGMSGGPIVYRARDGYHIIGMAVIGGGSVHFTKAVRDQDISRFLARYFDGVAPAAAGAGSTFGLPEKIATKLPVAGGEIIWIRHTKPSQALGAGGGHVTYVASRPLTLGDIDALRGVRRQRALLEARAMCFAELSAAEVEQARQLLTDSTDLSATMPVVDELDVLAGEAPVGLSRAADTPRNNLPTGIWKATATQRGFHVMPDAPAEWAVTTDGDLRRFFNNSLSRKLRGETQFSGRTTSGGTAVFRPALHIPVWNTVVTA